MRSPKAFTLIELLVVIAIIALLMSIVMPALKKAKDIARMVICASNQKQLVCGVLTYQVDNDDQLPPSMLGIQSNTNYWECGGFWTTPMRLNYHSENAAGGSRNGLAGGWIGKYLCDYNPISEVYNCPLARVDLDAPIAGLGNQTYQELYENGQAEILDCSYNLFWNYNGFDHTANGNQRRFAGPGKHSKTKLLTSDALFWNEAGINVSAWRSTHPIRSVGGTGSKTSDEQWYFLYDPSETLPEVKMNAGYVDGSVRRYDSKDTVRGILEKASYVSTYFPSEFQ